MRFSTLSITALLAICVSAAPVVERGALDPLGGILSGNSFGQCALRIEFVSPTG